MKAIERESELTINSKRINYLLELFGISKDELANRINGTRKKNKFNVNKLDTILSTGKITLPILKKIDTIFEKGLSWYISKRDVPEKKSSSIFFRKDSFNSVLNFESKKLTNKFEEKKFQIQSMSSLIDFNITRKLKTYTISYDVKKAAEEINAQFKDIEGGLILKKSILKPKKDYDYLKNYIRILEQFNIFVFEFAENWNKKEKANFDGLFMYPNMIVIKKQQNYYRRELFTLIHEFAHYILNIEEIDQNLGEDQASITNKIEQWCNEFVYYFFIKNYDTKIESLDMANIKNKYHKDTLSEIYSNTLLSKSALYTHLRNRNKISLPDYSRIMQEIMDSVNQVLFERKMKNKEERELLKDQGKEPKGFRIKPIQSKLYADLVKMNYFEGNITESKLCNYLGIKPDNLSKELY